MTGEFMKIRTGFGVGVVSISAVSCLLLLSSAAFGASGGNESAVVSSLLPGSSVQIAPLTTASGASSERLVITLASSDTPSGLTTLQQQFNYEEIGWRAGIAASLVNVADPTVTSYSVETSTGQVPGYAFNEFHGGFSPSGSSLNDPKLDSVASSAAITQMNSNLTVLKSVLSSGSVISADAQVLPVNADGNEFALEVRITVNQASSLQGHLGDVLVGLQTGLIGNMNSTLVEGLSIQVITANGTPVVGSWQETRAQTGTLQFADPSQSSGPLQSTAVYPNLTGGPSPSVAVIGQKVNASVRWNGSPSEVVVRTHDPKGLAVGASRNIQSAPERDSLLGISLILSVSLMSLTLVYISRRRLRNTRAHLGG
jgi:hypothetical protein